MAAAITNSLQIQLSAQDQDSQNTGTDWAGVLQTLFLMEELLTVESCPGEEESFENFLSVHFPCSTGCPHTHAHEDSTDRLNVLEKRRQEEEET